MAKRDPKDLLAAGAHFGHKTSRWHPKMSPYIYGERDGTHIIDLIKTVDLLDEAMEAVSSTTAKGQDILLVGTKKQAQAIIREAAERAGVAYVVERWMGGMLTNRETMAGRVKHLKKLEKQMEAGELEAKYNKLEVQRAQEEIDKLNFFFGGIKEMERLPGLVFVVDALNDHLAVKEANRLNIPVVALCDTNVDPRPIDFPIPANDDSIKTIKLVVEDVIQAIEDGKKKANKREKEE